MACTTAAGTSAVRAGAVRGERKDPIVATSCMTQKALKAVPVVFLVGVGRASTVGVTVCSAGAAYGTVVRAGTGGAGAVIGTKNPCGTAVRADTIKPRVEVDSSNIKDALNHALRTELHVTSV